MVQSPWERTKQLETLVRHADELDRSLARLMEFTAYPSVPIMVETLPPWLLQ